MSTNETDTPRVQRVRHELKKRELQVQRVERLSPLFQRVTLTGDSLADFVSAAHDDHVKIILSDATGETVMREYTPREFDTIARTLVLDFALHGEGPAASWAAQAAVGQTLTVAGPRGSFVVANDFDWYVLIGDETALPAIAGDLGVNPLALKLALTAYLVSLAVFIPISGWVADRRGSRTVFTWAIVGFMSGSLMCAFSSTLAGFVVSRFIQGIGGAMMVPVGRLILLRAVPKRELVKAMTWLTLPALLGPVLGPPLGGVITEYFHWRGIFLINVPVSVLGLILALRFIPDVREEKVPPLDARGFVLSGFGFAVLMLGLSSLGGHLMPTWVTLGCIVVGAIVIAAYVWHARRVEHPLIDFSLLSEPTYRAGVIGGSLFRIGMGAVPFLLPLMFQLGFGLSPSQSGLIKIGRAHV